MKRERMFWTAGLCATAVAFFVAGCWVGLAPLRRSYAMGGGPLESIARDLRNVAQSLSDRTGRSRTPKEVLEGRVYVARLYSENAAYAFCDMQPDYQLVAKQAAAVLEKNSYASAHGPDRARQYILHAAQGDACRRFRDPDSVIANR